MSSIAEPSPGIYLITLPLPFELQHVKVGLVRLDRGWMLIDAGMAGDASFRALESALNEVGVEWTGIRSVLVTHIHPDHAGGVPRVLEKSGASLMINRSEFEYLSAILEGGSPWMEAALKMGGVPAERWPEIRAALLGMRGSLPVLRPDRFLEDGDLIATANGGARVIVTPGHSPGHVCLYFAERRVLYAGDHMLGTITPNIAWMPARDMLGEYLDSLDKVAALDIELVIASHGEPFGNHRAWVAETRRHHDIRCSEILGGLGPGGKAAYELVPLVWPRELSSFHLYFALFEVLAHLEYLRRKGAVGCREKAGGELEWRKEADGSERREPSAVPASDYGV